VGSLPQSCNLTGLTPFLLRSSNLRSACNLTGLTPFSDAMINLRKAGTMLMAIIKKISR
jgi:hypothetical protein